MTDFHQNIFDNVITDLGRQFLPLYSSDTEKLKNFDLTMDPLNPLNSYFLVYIFALIFPQIEIFLEV